MGRYSWAGFERRAKKALTFLFSHVGLCAMVAGYSVAGGFLFRWLEQKEVKEPYNSTEVREIIIDNMLILAEKYGMSIEHDITSWRINMSTLLLAHDKRVINATLEERYDKTIENLEERWSIINSLFFCVTVITTIGYGHISPSTLYGKIVTIVYSLFGIPLMLLCLNNIGDSMAKSFRFTYRRIFCCCRKKENSDHYLLNSVQENVSKSQEPTAFKPYPYHKPKRKTMLISPPISATLHRGSDLPPSPKSFQDTSSKSSSSGVSKPSLRNNFHTIINSGELNVDDIISECASYTDTPVPGVPIKDNRDNSNPPVTLNKENISTTQSLHPLLIKDPIWIQNNNQFLSVNRCLEESPSSTSTRPGSPSSVWADHTSTFSFGSTGQQWSGPESSTSITWDPNIYDEEHVQYVGNRQKLPAGKTLVVYNTLSGDALKQQSRIQRRLALMHKAKHGNTRNESTTVFTDPISGQTVNGDVLGLNYRPIEPEATDKDTRVPMTLVLSFVTGYLCIGAILFSSIEGWTFMDAFYFSFTTLSTIGFGDLVPGDLSFETREAELKLIALSLYVLLGLAVIAMSFSLVQEEVVLKCRAFAKRIGLKDEH